MTDSVEYLDRMRKINIENEDGVPSLIDHTHAEMAREQRVYEKFYDRMGMLINQSNTQLESLNNIIEDYDHLSGLFKEQESISETSKEMWRQEEINDKSKKENHRKAESKKRRYRKQDKDVKPIEESKEEETTTIVRKCFHCLDMEEYAKTDNTMTKIPKCLECMEIEESKIKKDAIVNVVKDLKGLECSKIKKYTKIGDTLIRVPEGSDCSESKEYTSSGDALVQFPEDLKYSEINDTLPNTYEGIKSNKERKSKNSRLGNPLRSKLVIAKIPDLKEPILGEVLTEYDGYMKIVDYDRSSLRNRRRYILKRDKTRFLHEENAEAKKSMRFQRGDRVYGKYPDTTCFYPGTVITPDTNRLSKTNFSVCVLFDEEKTTHKVSINFLVSYSLLSELFLN
eukprot:GHVP01068409.1.p1 GENE.GHVP01068409.1~~GHVP01068409.1.p1  ORF type:complete len:435 (+),score=88.92 GHVP01068409.1:117-1307(+)